LTKVYGEVDSTLSYTLEISSAGRGAVLGDAFTGGLARAPGTDVGSYAINQGSLTNSNYNITIAAANLVITARPIFVTADANQTKVYGEADGTFTYTVTATTTGAGLLGTDGVTLTGALARAAGSNVGNYAINQGALAVSSGNNYSIQYTSRDYAITARPIFVTADANQTKVYGEADGAFTYTVEANATNRGLVGSDTFSGALTRVTGSDVGNYAINQGTLNNTNYAINFASNNFAITARPIFVAAATGQTKVYGETDPILAYSTAAKTTGAGLLGTDGVTLTGNIERAVGEDAGDYAINQGNLAPSALGNYNIQFTPADFKITQLALVVVANEKPVVNLSANKATKVYGEADPTLSVSLAEGSRLVSGDSLSDVTGTITRVAGESVGNYDVLLGQGSKTANYSISYSAANGAFSITPRAISITPNLSMKVQGALDPVLGVRLSEGSLALSDSMHEVVGELRRTAGEAIANYDVLLGLGEKSSNYLISYDSNNAAFIIMPSAALPVAGVILGTLDDDPKRKSGPGRTGRRSAGGKCFP
jgi:hypothetical protein